jgi:hypothetical protein
MHIILAFPFQSFCKQQSHATLEENSSLRTTRARAARALQYMKPPARLFASPLTNSNHNIFLGGGPQVVKLLSCALQEPPQVPPVLISSSY